MHQGALAALVVAVLALAHLPAAADAADGVLLKGAPAVSGDYVFLSDANQLLVRSAACAAMAVLMHQ